MIAFYILVSVMPFIRHPFWSEFVGDLTVVKITGLLCFGYAAFYLGVRPSMPLFFRTWQVRWAVLLCLIGMVSYVTVGAAVPLELSPFLSYLSFLALFLITLILVDSLQRLRWVILVAVGSMGYASLHILREWQKYGAFEAGYRPGWVTGDPNYYSLSALLCLPFGYYLLRPRQPQWERYFCLTCLGLTVLGLTLASSRGGLLGLTASVLFAAWRSKHRLKVTAAAVAVLIPLMALSPSSPLTRLLSPDRSDQESTDSRLALWNAGLKMIGRYPLTGIGVGNFKPLVPKFLEPGQNIQFIAHNTYLGIGAELGLPALGVFLAIFMAVFRSTEAIRCSTRRTGPLLVQRTAEGLQVGLIGYAVAIFFVSAEYQKLFWLMIFLSGCLPALARKRGSVRPWWARQSPGATEEPVSAVPLVPSLPGTASGSNAPASPPGH